MSITIYDGQEIVGLRLEALLQKLTELRPAFVKEAKKLAAAFVARTACNSFDRVTLGLPFHEELPIEGRHLLRAVDELNRRQAEVISTRRRDPAVDFSFELSVMLAGKRVLALPFVEHPSLRKMWEKQSWVSPLPYWDNTDRPEELTARQWNERRAIWKKALNDFGAPAETGFSFELSPERTYLFLNEKEMKLVLAALPSLEERAKSLALESLLKRLPAEEQMRPSQVMRLRESQAFRDECERLQGVLEPELTGDHLWEEVPPALVSPPAAEVAGKAA